MITKISYKLDAIADKLESKGLIKEALEIDKIADEFDQEAIKKDMFNRYKSYINTYQDYITVSADPKKYDALCAFILELYSALKGKDIKKAQEMYDKNWKDMEKHTLFEISSLKPHFKMLIEKALKDPSDENVKMVYNIYNDVKDDLAKYNRKYDPKHISEGYSRRLHPSERPWY